MAEPLVPAYPGRQRAYDRKYTQLGPVLPGTVGGPLANALARYDQQRVDRGLNPLSTRQTSSVLATALSGEAATPEKEESGLGRVLGGFGDNLRALTNIPNLARGLWHEVQAIPELPQQLGENLEHARNPLEALGGIASAPGVRLIPGSFVAENVLGGWNAETDTRGEVGNLADNPLFTALDVLPYAGKAAAATKTGKAAAAAGKRPLPSMFTRTVDDAGQLAPNRLGRVTDRGATKFHSSLVGQMVGRQSRDLASMGDEFNNRTVTNPGEFSPEMGRLQQRADKLAAEGAELMDDARRAEMYDGFTQDRSLIELIPDPKERDWAFRMAEALDDLQEQKIVEGTLIEVRGELYRPDEVRGLIRADTRADLADFFVDMKNRFADRAWNVDVDPDVSWNDTATILDRVDRIHRYGKGRDLSKLSTTKLRQVVSAHLEQIAAQSGLRNRALRKAMYKGDDTLGLPSLTKQTAGEWAEWFRSRKVGDDLTLEDVLPDEAVYFGEQSANRIGTLTAKLRQMDTPSARQAGHLAGRLEAYVSSGNYRQALTVLRRIRGQKRFADDRVLVNHAIEQVKYLRDMDQAVRALDEVKIGSRNLTPRTAATMHRQADKIAGRAAPARYGRYVEDDLQRLAQESEWLVELKASDPQLAETVMGEVKRRHYGSIPPEVFNKLRQSARAMWQDHAAADPIFVHRATIPEVHRVARPQVLDRKINPGSWNERAMTGSDPYVRDLAISMKVDTHQHVVRAAVDELLDEVSTSFGKSRVDVENMYRAAARKRWERLGGSWEEHLQAMIGRDWVEFNPAEYNPFPRSKRSSIGSGDGVMVPKGVAKNLERMGKANEGLTSTKAVQGPMKVFRTSVLALAPRWHIYNMLGGQVMVAARTNPVAVFRYGREAARMLRGTADEAVPSRLRLGSGAGTAPLEFADDFARNYQRQQQRIWRADMRKARAGDKAAQARMARVGMDYRAGVTMRRFLDEKFGDAAGTAADKAGAAVQWSYRMNGVVDDWFRAVSYLYGRDKAYRSAAKVGDDISKEAAEAAGIALVKKVMPDWARLTPLERTAVKGIFPFYGFLRHIIDYTASYPLDHPLRVSVMTNLVEAELDDWKSGWPQAWQSMFFFGAPDASGAQRAFDTSGFNPFSDVHNYARLLGFVTGDTASAAAITGQMSPPLQYALRLAGVDPREGSADLYPNMRVDPVTGRMVTDVEHGNMLEEGLSMFAPQVGFAYQAISGSNEYREMVRDDPAAAARAWAIRFGIPGPIAHAATGRRVDRYGQIMDAELNRQRVQQDAQSDALRTGDWSILDDFPGLAGARPALEQLDAQGALDIFRPQKRPAVPLNQQRAGMFSL